MQKLVFTNGNGESIDLTSAPYGITKWEGFSNAELNIQMQQVPFQDGGVYLDALINSRELSVTLAIQDNNNLSLRYEYRRNLISVLNPKLGEGTLVYTNDYLSKQIKVVPQIPLFENHNSNDSGTPKASLTFTACSPYWEDTEETEVVIENMASQVIENVGDVDIHPTIQIAGNFNGVEIYNNTIGKSLVINDDVDGKLIINTGTGNKSVSVQTYNFEQKISNGTLNDCCYYGVIDKVVIVGNNNDCYLLSKNNVLKKLSIVEGENFLGVASDGTVVAVCTQTNIYVSSDCESWQSVYTGSGIAGIIYNENLSLFIAYGNNIITSTDGDTWTDIAITGPIVDIAYSDTLIMGIGNNYVVMSSDGETWTDGTFSYMGIGITYNESSETFCALCSDTLYVQETEDGSTWSNINIYNFTYRRGIYYSPYVEGFVVVGTQGNYYVQGNLSIATIDNAVSTNFVGGKYISEFKCELMFGQHVLVKTNQTIFNVLVSFPPHNIYNIIKSDDKYVAGTKDGYIFYSEDGIIWKQSYYVGNTSYFMQVDYSSYSGKYVAIYGGGDIVKTSSDGIDWKSETIPSGVGYLYDVACSSNSNEIYICGRFYDIYTIDGNTWEKKSLYTTESSVSVIYDVNLQAFLETGDRGIAYKIDDGFHYRNVIFNAGNLYTYLTGMAYSPTLDMYIAVGYSTITNTKDPRCFYIKGDNDYAYLYTGVLRSDNYALGIIWHNTLNAFLLWTSTGNIYISYDGFNYDLYANYEDINVLTEDYLATNNIGYVNELSEETNIISKISNDSDLNFTLTKGENKLSLYYGSGELNCKFIYKNRYIGV